MRSRCTVWVLALLFVSFFTIALPHQARADADSIAHQCDDGSFNKDVLDQRSAFMQQASSLAHTLNTLVPVAPAMDQCLQMMSSIFSALPGLSGNPFSALATAIVKQVVDSLIQAVVAQCQSIMSQVTSAIQQAKTALANMVKICIPIPKFNLKLDLPAFSAPACSGGVQINTLGAFTSPSGGATSYIPAQFQR